MEEIKSDEIKPRDTYLKKEDMDWLYSTKENPWEYGHNHFECYNKLFESIKHIIPENLFIFELGSGEGYFAEQLLKFFGPRVKSYVGTDISKLASDKFLSRLKPLNPGVLSLAEFDFENKESYDTYHNLLLNSNLIIAVESLYLASVPTQVIKLLNPHLFTGTELLICDSTRRYVVREYPNRKLGYEVLAKVVNPLYIDKSGTTRKLTSFLTVKR